jgi:hypothetical protein
VVRRPGRLADDYQAEYAGSEQTHDFEETAAFAQLVLHIGAASWLKPAIRLRDAVITSDVVQSVRQI